MFWWPWPAVSENSQMSGHRALEILTPEFANSRARQTLKGNWYGFAWQHSPSRNASFLCFPNSVFSILSSNFSGSLGSSISVIAGVFSSSLSQILRETQRVSGPRRSRKILPTWGCSALSFQSRLSLGSSLSIKHYGMPLTALLLHVGCPQSPQCSQTCGAGDTPFEDLESPVPPEVLSHSDPRCTSWSATWAIWRVPHSKGPCT